jgi:hypothetical protein
MQLQEIIAIQVNPSYLQRLFFEASLSKMFMRPHLIQWLDMVVTFSHVGNLK